MPTPSVLPTGAQERQVMEGGETMYVHEQGDVGGDGVSLCKFAGRLDGFGLDRHAGPLV